MNSSNIDRVISLAAKDTKKGARVIAKVFYRMLLKQGFSENQIIDITTNILSCLIEKLNGNETRIDSSRENEKKTHQKYPLQQAQVTGTYTKFRNRYHERPFIELCQS